LGEFWIHDENALKDAFQKLFRFVRVDQIIFGLDVALMEVRGWQHGTKIDASIPELFRFGEGLFVECPLVDRVLHDPLELFYLKEGTARGNQEPYGQTKIDEEAQEP
jgi:hypothetical protein